MTITGRHGDPPVRVNAPTVDLESQSRSGGAGGETESPMVDSLPVFAGHRDAGQGAGEKTIGFINEC